MPLLETQSNKAGNLIIREQWVDLNYCRADVRVLLSLVGTGAKPLQFGEILFRSTTDPLESNFNRAGSNTTLPANFTVAITIDDRIGEDAYMRIQASEGFGEMPNSNLGNVGNNWETTASHTVPLACLVRGDCIVREGAILFGGDVTPANKAALLAQLEKQGIQVVPQLTGAFAEPRPYV